MPAAKHISHGPACSPPIRLCLQKDSWAIDYQATLNTLNAARKHGASHFVLLSAICVQKPLLEFQHAKLKFEETLQSAGDITYSIVRPTAFFKSLAGQVGLLQSPGVHLVHGVCFNDEHTGASHACPWGTPSDLLHCEGPAFPWHDNSSCGQGRGGLHALPTDAHVRRRLGCRWKM